MVIIIRHIETCQHFGMSEVDLYASRLDNKLATCWEPDPWDWKTEAFTFWDGSLLLVFATFQFSFKGDPEVEPASQG